MNFIHFIYISLRRPIKLSPLLLLFKPSFFLNLNGKLMGVYRGRVRDQRLTR